MLAALLAALPLQAVAQTQGVSISPTPVAQYLATLEGEDVTFTVRRTGDNSNALTVSYETSEGGGPETTPDANAVEGDDYTAIPESHTFPAGDSTPHEFSVTINDDDSYEPNQYFKLTVSGDYQDGSITRSFSEKVTVRIRENDERFLTLSPVSDSALVAHPEFMAKEGGTGTDNQLTISLNETLPYDLNIAYTVGDDPHTTASATASVKDFTMADGTATIPDGDTSVTIDIGIEDDDLVEPTEYFTLGFRTPGYDDPGNALGTFNPVNFQDSKLTSQPLSVSIMDNDTATTGGVVYLRGEGGGGITGFPSTRKTLTEGLSTTITAEIAGAAPTSDIEIPLKVTGFPSAEVTSADYSIDKSITITAGQKTGSVTLQTADDMEDERYRELLVVEIDEMGTNFPTAYEKGDRSTFEVIILDNDKTPVSLQNLNRTALTEASGTRTATFQLRIDRRPKADPMGTPPFTGADADEGDAKLDLAYTGKATRGGAADYTSTADTFVIRKSPAALPDGCSAAGEAVTCTVMLDVRDDNLYEGGVGTTEDVKIDLDTGTGNSSFNDGFKEPTGLSLTIEDNDEQPMFSIANMTGPESGNLTFTVMREGARGNNVSVTAGTANHAEATNRATANTDYREKNGSLRFGSGKTSETFVVAITDDIIDEPDETFAVTLSNPVDNQGLPRPAIKSDGKTAVGTITDNDDAPTELTISVDTNAAKDKVEDTIAEAAGETTVTVTATIDSPTRFATDQTVTVTVGNAANEGEASKGADGDYEAVDEFTFTIPATEVSGKGTFELTPVNDSIDDDDEKISVEGAVTGMTVTHAAITIEDDDTRGIVVAPVTLTLNEVDDTSTSSEKENTTTYGVKVTSQPEGGTVTVNVASEDTTVAAVSNSSLEFNAENWETTQLVTVTAQDDTIDNTGNERATTISHTVSADDTDYEGETVEDVEVTVTDDDEAPMALTITVDTDISTPGDQDKIGEGADTPTVRIAATLDGVTQFDTDRTITITIGDSDKDTATEGTGGDYNTVDDFDITLPAGESDVSHDRTLTLNNDSVDEADEETVTVTGALTGATVKGTTFAIEDNDATPTVTLVLTPASINESGATNASTVTATMDGTSSEAVTLTVSATPVSPAVAGDLTLSDNKTLTIPANTRASTGVVTIAAVDNDVDAANKTVTVAATATGGNGLVQPPGPQTLTITDDDTRGITVSKATLTLDEEDNAATEDANEHQDSYTVVLDSEPSGGTVTIGVASAGTDVAGVAPATLAFTASNWDEPQTVTVTAVPDGIDNPNDRRRVAITHTVTATGTDYDGATASGVTVTVNDDDGAPTLSINNPSVTEVDSTATATLTFTVRLAPNSGNTVTVDYADAGTGTATSGGTDYATLAGGTLTFAPSETSKSVAVTVSGDDIDESDETVVVRLSSPSNATLTGGATTLDGTGTINDNDATPTVSVADAAAVTEGNVAAPDPPNNMTFAVTLSAVSGLDVTVPYTLAGTATAGTDYTEPDPRSVTIAAGTTQANIAIPVAGDEVDEENETITVTLGTPTNATVSTAEGAGAASGTITDDDTRGVSITPTALTVAEADNTGTADEREDQATYKVVLTSEPTGAVTVNLKSGDESVARIDTASLTFDADDWNSERTVTVTGQADVIDNTGDERATTIAHTVSAAGTDYADETAEGVAVTVTDDDAAPSGITLTANPDSVTENGGAKTITVTAAVNGATRYAQARTVSVSVGGGTAISGTDYTAVESFDITIGVGEDDASNTFTLTPDDDVLAEGNETIDVTGTLSGITITPDEITITDDDDAPSGITLSVDTNGAEDGTPSTVGEDAGGTVVTVTATVNGDTRYVEAQTVAVSVADGTAESPADYAAVSNFNITIAAGAASHTGNFTVTPVDDDLDEPNETINVTGTLSSVTITGATVTFTDNDDPVSFSIADAEADEGGKMTFMVSRAGAGDNVASVKVATATDSGDGVNAADADDYTAIATAQTVSFAKGVASQTVEVQTTQDDLFEPDETFRAVLSAPALAEDDPGTGVSIAAGKGTATGTIKNDDTQPSFAVADASASEGDAITFTVTRSGAMDNAVSVKWNTKADSSDGANAASTTDYTPVTTATTLNFARGVSSRTFTVATTEDLLAEGNETFLVELTGAVGGTISTAEATGTINDDDAAPTGITLSVDADTGTMGTQTSLAEEGGVKTVRVTATINGATRFATAQTVTVTVGKDGDSATEGTDYAMVGVQSIEIPIGDASAYVDFPLTPTTDVLSEGSETISVDGTLTGVTFTNSSITITDDDAAPTGITLSVDADTGTMGTQTSLAEEGGVKTVRVTATIGGTTRFATAQTVTVTVGKDGDSATAGTDYATVDEQSIEIPIGDASAYVEFMLTPTTDVLFEGSETISVEGTLTDVTFTNTAITITDDDAAPSAITLSVDTNAGGDGTPTTVVEAGNATTTTVRVIAEITSATRFATEQTVTVMVGKDGDSASGGTDYNLVADQSIKIPAGADSAYVDFPLTLRHDILDEPDETISVDGELTGVTFTAATITITDDDAAPEFITLAVDTNAGGNGTPTSVGEETGATTVRVTATITSATRFSANQAVTFEVGKSTDSATEDTDYTEVGTLTITIDGGDASGSVDFTLTPTSDVLDEPNETISVHGTQADITFTDATITITDDDAAPTGITLSVDTNGSTSGTPSTVAEDAGATVVTVTATVNGTTRYVDARTVAVSVDDDTAASPADYAAVTNFNITIAAGAASQSETFTVTPVDDDLDEANETIDVTGTLSGVTVAAATVTLTDTDDPVSFSIADADATEGGKVTFTVSRGGAGDNVASVKIATAADSGDDVNAAGTDDYTAIATARTLNFAKGVASQTVEVQTTQDDLFEPDETFKATLSAPALAEDDPGTGVSIETGKGTAIGTIKNDDTEPSFAVADASASEGDAITFTVTRSGAMDNAVSVKWNTKADSSDEANAASASDYTRVTTARTLTFAKGVRTQTFTVATTEDVLDEENETFLVELTGATGATIATAQATGTINDDDAAPTGITLTVSPVTVGEEDGETEITVTATVNGTTRYVDAKTVTVSVGGGTTISDTDYGAVENFDITIAAGDASKTGTFDLTPTDDDLHEGNETIDLTGTSGALTITNASITLEDDDTQPSFAVADASASEGDAITFTVTRSGAMDNAVSVKWNTKADSSDGANAASATDYTEMTTATKLDFAKGVSSQSFTVATTEDTLNEADETFLIELTEPVGATITDAEATGTITNDDAAPTTLTLAVDADNDTENVQSSLAENGGAKTVKVTATLGGSTQFDVDKTLTLIVGDDDDSATEGTDYTNVADVTLTIPAGDQDVEHTFTLTPTDDAFNEASETISFDATITGVTVNGASIALTSDDDAPSITLTVDADKDTENVQSSLAEDGGVKTVRVTATLDGTTRLEASADLTLAVGKNSDSAVEGTDYTNVADRTVTIGAGVASVTHDFTLTPTNDDLYEGSETISLDGTLTGVAVTDTSLTLTDDDAAPSGITLSVDTNGAEDGTPSTVAEDAGATVVTVTATVNGTTRYVDAKTVAVSVDDDTAASPADYAAVSGFNITIAAGAASKSETFTVTPVDDDLDEANETIDVTGTLTGITITPATVTLTDTDAPVSFSIADAEATEGGAITFTVSRGGAGDNVASVKIATSADSGDDVNAAGTDDYTAISPAQTLNFAKGVASQTVEVQTTQDDLFEPDETFKATLSAPALAEDDPGTGVSIETGKGTAIGTIKNDDTEPSFAVADASASEGDAITFTVTRSGAMDNAVSVKWNTKADSSDGANAASAADYTRVTTAQTLTFAKGVRTQTFAVATTEDTLHEGAETFLVELTEATGATIATAEATGTINDDDAAPTALTLSVDADTGTMGTQTSLVEDGGAKTVRVTATLGGSSTFTEAKTVTVEVGPDADGATEGTDYTEVTSKSITINAGSLSGYVDFTLTPIDDDIDEPDEGISIEGTLTGITVAGTSLTITDDEVTPTVTLVLTPTAIDESGDDNASTVTATLSGKSSVAVTLTVAAAAGADTVPGDFTVTANKTLTIVAGATTSAGTVTITAVDNDVDAPNKSVTVSAVASGGGVANPGNQTLTINDDEGVPTVTLMLTPTAIDESGDDNESTVTATLSGKSNAAVTLTVAAAAGADTAAADFTLSTTTTLTIAAGATTSTGSVTITAVDNDIDAPNKSVTVSATASGGGVANPDNQTLTINDDEGTPTVTLVLTPTAIDESGDDNASTVTAMLSGKSSAAVTVTVSVPNDAPVTLSNNAALSIAAGATTSTGAVTITAVDNNVDAPNRTVTVSATASGRDVANPTSQTLTINDDDAAPTGITLSVDTNGSTEGTPSTVAEDAGATVVTVTATVNGTTRYVDAKTVAVSVDDDTAASPADYAAVTGFNITIVAGAASKSETFTVTPVDDDLDEANETIDVTGTLTGITITPATVTLTDTDAPVSFSIADAEATEGGAITFTVSRGGAGDNVASVKIATSADSGDDVNAAGTDDYTAISPAQTLNFAKGVASQTVEVQTTQDDLFEPDETFKATLSAPALAEDDPGTGVSIETGKGTAIGTIKNDDTEPSFAVADASASEGDAITFTVTRSGAMDNAVSVKWNTKADSSDGANAASAADYTRVTTAQTLTFAKGVRTQTFAVATTEDTLHEGAETFLVELTEATGATIATAEATGTINDDDAAPTALTLSVDADTGTMGTQTSLVEDGGAKTVRVTATLGGSSTFTEAKTVTVEVGPDADGATEGTDYTEVTSKSITINAGSLSGYVDFTLTPIDDDIDEPDEGISIEGTLTGITVAGTSLTITDDEVTPTVTLVLTPTAIDESGDDNASTVTATLSGKSSVAVTLTVAAAAGADTVPGDFTVTANKTLTIVAGATTSAGTVTITAVDNDVDAPNKSVTVSAVASGGGVANPGNQTLTINDDEGVPTVTLMLTPTAIDESGDDNESTVTATLSGKSNAAVTLTVAAAAGADTAAADFTLSTTTTLTIAAGATTSTGSVTITAVDNDIDAPNKSVTVSATASGGGVANPDNQTLTINDDEGTPTVTLVLTPTAIDESGDDNASTVTAMLSGKSSAAVTVTVSVPNDAPVTLSNNAALSIAAGATTSTGAVTITAVDNNVDAPNRTVTVSATASGRDVANPTSQTLTINDDDAAPTGITLSVDTNGSTEGTPSTVAEDAGATVVTVTATVNGTTRYVDAKTVAVSVDDDTAASPADYAAVTGFNITIVAGAASKSETFTVTPVDDDLDEANETIDVTGTLTGITITPATVTLTDTDAPVSFSIADAEATEGGAITFTVSRGGAGDNVASVKIATSTDSGDDVNAAGTDDYTAISPAQTLNFAKGVASQTVEVQTTQDDLFEPDETFKATLSAPALAEDDPGTGVSIETGKGTAIGTIKNDDTEPSFAVADASASEGDAITFTVTRSGAMDNAVSVKWNTKADSSDGANAASAADYTRVTTAQTLTFAKGVRTQTFAVATTEDTLHEGAETFLVELTEATGATIATAEATGTINDDDAAPTALTLSVDADTGTMGTQTSLVEDGGAKTVRVTATLGGSSTFTEAKTVTVEVGPDADGATEGTDYTEVTSKSITINAGSLSGYVDFTLTPIDDDIDEPDEGISIEGTLTGITVAGTSLTITDDEVTPTVTLVLTPTAIDESGDDNASTVTATLSGKSSVAVTLTVAAAAGADTVPGDFTVTANKTLTIVAGATTSAGTVTITAVDNDVDAPNKSVTVSAVASGGGVANPGNQTLTINDDEGVPTVTLMLTPTAIDESGDDNESTVTATLSGKSNAAVTLTVAAAAGADTAAADFTLSTTTTLTIAAGATTSTGSVTITAVDNDIDAPNKSVTVSATASGGGVANPDNQTLTINDDEGTPTVTLVLTPTAIDESGDDNASTVTAMLSGKSSAAVTVTVSVPNDAPVTLSNNAALSIAAGATTSTGAVTITAVDNNVDAPNRTVTVSATASGRDVANPTSQTLTINDDDAAPTGITLSVDTNGSTEGTPSTVAEDAGATVVTVTATVNGTTRYVDAKTVAVSVDDDTAASPADYAAVTGFNITIVAGAASKSETFTVTPVDDDLDEANETIDVTGTLTGITITPATVTLTDTDAPVSFSIADAEATEGGAITFTVSRGGAGDNVASVKIATSADSGDDVNAAGTDDYTAISPAQTLNFAKGVASQTVEVQTTQDDLFEPDETFKATLSAPALAEDDPGTGVSIETGKGTAIGTIKNDDTEPSFAVADASASEGDAITFTVTRSGAMDNAVSVKWNTKADSSDGANAASAADYTRVTTAQTLTFAKGVRTQTFAVATTEDTLHEGAETFLVELTEATGATIATAEATGTINDDDAAPTALTLSVDADTGTMGTQTSLVEDGGAKTVRVTATLGGSSTFTEAKTVTVEVGPDADGATEGTDYTEVTSKSITINAGSLSGYVDFTLTPIDDDIDEPDEGISIEGTLTGITVAGTSLTITDDEVTPTVTLVLTPTAIDESGDDNASTVTATLSGKSSVAVTLTVAAAAGADTVPGDFTVTANKTLTIVAGATTSAGTVTITAVDNDVDAPNKSVTVSAVASGGGVANPGNQTLTINDDEGIPTATLMLTPTTINETGATNSSTVTATLSGKSNTAVTLTVAAAAGADTAAADFTLSTTTTLTIAAGATTSTGAVTITAVDNDIDAPNKSVTVSATASGGGVANPDNQTLTINDDEGTPTVTLVLTPTAIDESGDDNASTVTAMLSGKSSAAVTVTVSVPNDAPVTLSNNAALSIAAGATTSTGAVTITAVDNNVDAPNQTVTVSATASGRDVANPTSQTLTINDDDAAPTGITLSVSPTAVGEEDGETEITVTATVNGTTRYVDAKTVTVSVGGGTAISGTDYDAVANFDITIAASDASKTGTFDLTPINDVLSEANETINVAGTSGSLTITPTTVTITDDDAAPGAITISVDADTGTDGTQTTIAENGGAKTVRVTATITGETRFVEARTVTLEVGADADSATEGADYTTVARRSITIDAGAASGYVEFTLTPTQDVLHEGNETISLDGTLTGVTVTDATITLTDDDAAPSGITLTVSPTTVGEGAGETEITVTATVNGTTRYVDAKTVTVSVGGGTATSDTDYDAVANFDIVIAAGDASKAGTFDLTPTQDDLHEGSETIGLDGTVAGVTVTDASITLTDDDGQPSFAVADASADEGDTITFTVTRSGAMDNAVSVKWNTKAATGAGAASTGDYTATTTATKLDFASGASSQTFTVATTEDTLHEGDETFLVELTDPVGAIISDAEATGTITDDDAAPTALTLSVDADTGTMGTQTSLAEDGGAKTVRVTATLGGSSTFAEAKTVTVEVGPDADGATEGTDYTEVTSKSITINAGSLSGYVDFTLTPTDDDIDEPNEGISIEGTLTGITVAGTSITLTDDEGTRP